MLWEEIFWLHEEVKELLWSIIHIFYSNPANAGVLDVFEGEIDIKKVKKKINLICLHYEHFFKFWKLNTKLQKNKLINFLLDEYSKCALFILVTKDKNITFFHFLNLLL